MHTYVTINANFLCTLISTAQKIWLMGKELQYKICKLRHDTAQKSVLFNYLQNHKTCGKV